MSRKPVKRGDRNKAWRSSVRQGSPRYRTVQMTRHLVVTEGTETEPRYFNGMRLLLGEANGFVNSFMHKNPRIKNDSGR